jgi:hypothetical protein
MSTSRAVAISALATCAARLDPARAREWSSSSRPARSRRRRLPAGRKWKIALEHPAEQKYMICNADEGDPGAFMDRAVIEGDPHRLIEGMALAAYAIGATKAYVYLRAEYPLAIERLAIALEQARELRSARRRSSSAAASTSRSTSRWAPARSSAAKRPP